MMAMKIIVMLKMVVMKAMMMWMWMMIVKMIVVHHGKINALTFISGDSIDGNRSLETLHRFEVCDPSQAPGLSSVSLDCFPNDGHLDTSGRDSGFGSTLFPRG